MGSRSYASTALTTPSQLSVSHQSRQTWSLRIWHCSGCPAFNFQIPFKLRWTSGHRAKYVHWLIVHAIGNGDFIVVLDSTDRENEGDLIIAAEDITTQKMAFMVRYTR